MSEVYLKSVTDTQGVIIGLTADDTITMAEDFEVRYWQLVGLGQYEAAAEALELRRLKAVESLYPKFLSRVHPSSDIGNLSAGDE